MKPAQKASAEHYRRLFTPEDEARHVRQEAEYAHLEIVSFHVHGHIDAESAKCATVRVPQSGSKALVKQIDWLGESAALYTQIWKKTITDAAALFGSGSGAAPQRPITAIVDGRTVSFETVEEKFGDLVGECRRLRNQGSSVEPLINDAYGQIVAMGWEAVPFLLREVKRQSGHWFTALKWITGEDLIKPQMRGNIRTIREAWLRWGTEHGHELGGHSARRVDEEASSPTP